MQSSPRKPALNMLCAAIAFCTVLPIANVASAAGLQSEMDSLFSGMTNVTMPGVYETQRRGVLAGGRVTTKNKIFNENLVSFTPPSWKAGCGGVDLFGGSFSFINSDQLIQLLRSVASNATGYAFQLALDNVSPDISKHINEFQKKIQQLNQYLGNSCQLAQGLVNNATSGMDFKSKTDASMIGTASGLFTDFFASKQTPDGKEAVEVVKKEDPAKYEKMTGNIVWKSLKDNRANSWFKYGDDDLLESMMSITGTIIVGDLKDDPNAAKGSTGAKTNPIHTIPGNQIGLVDLLVGGSITIYSCAHDKKQCAGNNTGTLPTRKADLKGMQKKVLDMLIGTESKPGIISKFANNEGTLRDEEKAFLAEMPGGLGTVIRQLSVLNPDAANIFARDASGAIALAMMYQLADQLITVVRTSLSNAESSYVGKAHQQLALASKVLIQDYTILKSQFGDVSEQLEKYNILLTNIRKQKYMLSTMTNKTK